MADRNSLRLSATLLFIGEVLLGVAQVLHPAGGTTYEATFADYAARYDNDSGPFSRNGGFTFL